MKTMNQVNQMDYFARHLHSFFPYLTVRKIYNLALNLIEKKYKVACPRSMPSYIKIEPTPACHLRCLGCKQRDENFKKQFNKRMKINIDDFKKIIDPLADSLLGVSLSLYGEPLLHEDISSLIAYAHRKNVAVSFPTNLSVNLSEISIDNLVKSGLDALFVSLDGASEETYKQYRVGGNFSLVMNNVKSIAAAKKKYGLKRPVLIWKFVVFEHNKHELDIVKNKYKELGFDTYEIVPDNASQARRKQIHKHQEKCIKSKKTCYWLYHTMIIRWNGEVLPCCRTQLINIGNAIDSGPIEIWRSEAYNSLREGFSDHKKMHDICRTCMGLQTKAAVMQQREVDTPSSS